MEFSHRSVYDLMPHVRESVLSSVKSLRLDHFVYVKTYSTIMTCYHSCTLCGLSSHAEVALSNCNKECGLLHAITIDLRQVKADIHNVAFSTITEGLKFSGNIIR